MTESEARETRRIITREGKRVKGWLRDHRGILTKIARKLSVSPQLVRSVAWGECHSTGRRVEAELRAQGWPELLDRGWAEERVE